MSDNGGKGGKSALKSPASKGKDDKMKGRKVQFDSEDMFDEKFETNGNGKADAYSGKGNGGKGGKGDKGGSGKKEAPPLLLKVEQEIPENVVCLMMDCEAAQILQGIQEHMVLLSKDPSIKIPSSFDRALQYATRGNHYTDPHSVRQLLEPLKKEGVSDAEMCVIANTGVESAGEAFGLMPSLKAKKKKVKEPLKSALTELEKLKIVMESTKKTIVLD